MTLEQQRALAMANARLRLQEVEPPPAKPAAPEKTWRDSLADVVEMARPGAIGKKIGEGIDHAAYNAGAAVNDTAAGMGAPAPFAAGLGTAVNVGVQALPMMIGGEWGKAAQPAFERGGEKMMQKALRPTWEMLKSGKAQRAGRTMLEEGLNPTRAGVDAMSSGIANAVTKADDIVANASGSLNKNTVAANALNPLMAKVEKSPLPSGDINTVTNAWSEFLAHPLLTGQSDIPVQLANEMKKAAYKKMGDSAYGLGLKPAAERDAVKALAHELRVGIEGVAPAVAPLNAQARELLNAKKIAERRVLMGGNNNLLPLGASVATAVNNPAAALGLWANSSDLVKSLLARALYSGQIPASAGRIAGGFVGAQSAQPE